MQRNFTISILLLLTILLLMNACKEDFLSTEPLSFYAPENVFVNEEGFESALITLRKQMKIEHYGTFNWITAEHATSDIAVAAYNPDFSFVTPSSSTRMPFLRMFDDAYDRIKNANVIISRIDDIEWNSGSARDRILAEAYWHRAYYYYRLVHSYGDVPFVAEEIDEVKLDFFTHSRWAILDKIEQDLELAVESMPESGGPGVPTRYAGYHLLTKVYLAIGNFDEAIDAASQVINGPFSLVTHRFGGWANDEFRNVNWDLHRHENIYHSQNTETVHAVVDRDEAPNEAKQNSNKATNYGPHYWDARDETGSRAYVIESAQGDTLMRGQGIIIPTNHYQFYIWEIDGNKWDSTPDTRRADLNWIEMTGDLVEIYYNNENSPNFGEKLNWRFFPATTDTMLRWASWPHYKIYNPTALVETRRDGGYGDSYVFRLAETYLLRAEAYLWNNNNALAADDINKVRERANATPIGAGDVTIDYIFDERARELYTEEPRHTEMVRVSNIMARLNMGGYSLETLHESSWWYDRLMEFNRYYEPGAWLWNNKTAKIEPFNIYWPVPQSVITSNTLGVINQNQGYIGAENNQPPLETIE